MSFTVSETSTISGQAMKCKVANTLHPLRPTLCGRQVWSLRGFTFGLYQLHFRYTSAYSKLPSILPLLGFIIKPLCENTLSTGAELAGIAKTRANSDLRQLNSTSVQILGVQSGLKSCELIVARYLERVKHKIT